MSSTLKKSVMIFQRLHINDLVDVTRYLRLHKSVLVENFISKVGEHSLGLMNVGMVENKVICK